MIAKIFFFLYFTSLHPLHLSVTDVHHNSENRTLEITQRIFADDLEDALRKNAKGYKVDVLNPQDPAVLSELIGDYILENFKLYLNNQQVRLNYLGYELEEDAVWVYLEVPKVRDFRSIRVKNTVFFEMFDDQTNLINIKRQGNIRSLKLNPEKEQGQLSY